MRLKTIAAAVFAASGFASGPVFAQWAVACVNCDLIAQTQTQTLVMTLNQIESAVSQAKDRIVAAIQGASTAQTTATSESGKIVAEANAKTAADMKKLEVQIKAVPLDPCSVTAVAKSGSAAMSSRKNSGAPGAEPPTKGATSDMTDSLRVSSGAKSAPSPEVAAAKAANGACGSFASGSLRDNACRSAGFSTGIKSGFPNADISATTLFDGPQSAADLQNGKVPHLTIKGGDSTEGMAVSAFIRNLKTPVDLRTLTGNELNSEAGRNYMALRDAYDANMSLANKPLNDQFDLMISNSGLLPTLKQLTKGEDADYVVGSLNRDYPSWKTDGISISHLIRLESERRYLNEKWHARMAAADDKQLLHEQVQMQAMQGWVMVQLLERIQQLNILQGAVAGATIRAEKMPLLIAAHKAAKQ